MCGQNTNIIVGSRELQDTINQLSLSLNRGQIEGALQETGEIISKLIQYIEQNSKNKNLDYGFVSNLNLYLNKIGNCLEINDFIQVADILEYEICDILNQIGDHNEHI